MAEKCLISEVIFLINSFATKKIFCKLNELSPEETQHNNINQVARSIGKSTK